MDKKKRNRYIVYGVVILLALLAWFYFMTPTGKKVATQTQSGTLPFGVPAGGPGATNFYKPSSSSGGGSCGCTISLCDGSDNLQVKSAPDWTKALLSDSFGVNFTDGGVAFNYGGLTPTQVYGVYF